MTEHDEARALIEAFRAVHTPGPERVRAALRRVDERIVAGEAEVESGTRSSGLRRGSMIAVSLAAVLLVGIAIGRGGRALQSLTPPVAHEASYQRPAEEAPTQEVVPGPEPAPPRVEEVLPEEVEPPADPPVGDAASTSPPPARPKPRPKAAPPEPLDDATLHAEMALLSAAQSAMRAGNPARALEQLDRHAARFPASMLAEEREVARIEALCELGRDEAVAKAKRGFAKRFADSPLRGRAAKVCAGPEGDP